MVCAAAKHFCAIKLRSGPTTILLIYVYLPTDYHTDVSAAECLSEMSGFFDSQFFDHLLIDKNEKIYIKGGCRDVIEILASANKP